MKYLMILTGLLLVVLSLYGAIRSFRKKPKDKVGLGLSIALLSCLSWILATKESAQQNRISAFTQTVIAAQNDDRQAFDQLEIWARDRSFPLREKALNAFRSILDKHSPSMVRGGFKIPWEEGIDPSKLSFDQLRQNYQAAPAWLKPGLIEDIWKRENIPKKQRMEFLVEVVKRDSSLTAVEYAGRYLSSALDAGVKPLAIKQLLQAWIEKKSSIK